MKSSHSKLIDMHPYGSSGSIRSHANTASGVESYLASFFGRPAVLLGSARIGIYEALRFFKLSRRDQVLVPDFLCRCVMHIVSVTGIPVLTIAPRLKAVLVFHQWGYPQDMDKVLSEAKCRNLVVIEDCVHSFDSKYKGRAVGTFGEAAVFGFSKLFPTYSGGVLVSENRALLDFVRGDSKKKKGFKNWLASHLALSVNRKVFDRGIEPYFADAVSLNSIHFPNIATRVLKLLPRDLLEFKKTLDRRKAHYLFLMKHLRKDAVRGEFDPNLEVNPVAVPVFLPEEKLNVAAEDLAEIGIKAEVLHFDINRNIFNSDYKKCLALPCHQNISQETLAKMVEVVNRI